MPEYEFSPRAQAFLDAWKEWDRVSTRISTMLDAEHKNGRTRRLSALTLQKETDDMVNTLRELSEELNVNSLHMTRTLQELRREGVDHAKALHSVIVYLNGIEIPE